MWIPNCYLRSKNICLSFLTWCQLDVNYSQNFQKRENRHVVYTNTVPKDFVSHRTIFWKERNRTQERFTYCRVPPHGGLLDMVVSWHMDGIEVILPHCNKASNLGDTVTQDKPFAHTHYSQYILYNSKYSRAGTFREFSCYKVVP